MKTSLSYVRRFYFVKKEPSPIEVKALMPLIDRV